VCSVASREPPIYRIARGWRGSGKVDHGAASPAAGRARRGRCRVLLVQAKLEVVLAWSGDVWLGRISSGHVAAVAGSSSPSTAAAVQGLVVAMSGGIVVARRGER
jgi:hypothetical protein